KGRPGTKAGVADLPMRPGKTPPIGLRPEAVDDRQRLLEAIVSLAQRRERNAKLVMFPLVPASAHSELDPSPAHLIGSGNDLGQGTGDPERDRRHEGAEPDASRL